MKINVYYGGRGLLDDPTLYVLKKDGRCFTGTSGKHRTIQYI